jgi:lactoylglutathione lyase
MSDDRPVREARVVLTVEDFDTHVRLYRDVLGMSALPAVQSPGGRVVILDAGRATIELVDAGHASYIDQIEVGRRTAGPVRLALAVDDVDRRSQALREAGVPLVAPPTPTPFGSRNSRFAPPGAPQLTLFG